MRSDYFVPRSRLYRQSHLVGIRSPSDLMAAPANLPAGDESCGREETGGNGPVGGRGKTANWSQITRCVPALRLRGDVVARFRGRSSKTVPLCVDTKKGRPVNGLPRAGFGCSMTTGERRWNFAKRTPSPGEAGYLMCDLILGNDCVHGM